MPNLTARFVFNKYVSINFHVDQKEKSPYLLPFSIPKCVACYFVAWFLPEMK